MKCLGMTKRPAVEIKEECWNVNSNCRQCADADVDNIGSQSVAKSANTQQERYSGKPLTHIIPPFLQLWFSYKRLRYNHLLTRARSYCSKTALHRSIKVSQKIPSDIDCNHPIERGLVHVRLNQGYVQVCTMTWRAVKALSLTSVSLLKPYARMTKLIDRHVEIVNEINWGHEMLVNVFNYIIFYPRPYGIRNGSVM